jgi:hypothetical protein
MAEAQALLPDFVARDGKISSPERAKAVMDVSLKRLQEIRVEYNMPRTCR